MKCKYISLFIEILIVCLFCGCIVTPRYYVIEEDHYFLNKPLYTYRYIVLNAKIINKSPEVFSKTIALIQRNKFYQLQRYLDHLHEKNDAQVLDHTLLCIAREEYKLAQQYLQRVKDKDYECLVKLLQADVQYEIQKIQDIHDASTLRRLYQQAYDCNPSKINSKIIRLRMKHILYNY